MAAAGKSFLGGQHRNSVPTSVSCPVIRDVRIVKVVADPRQSTELDQRSKSADPSNMQSQVCSEAASECYPYTHSTHLYDKMLTNGISSSNDLVKSCGNIQINLSNVF